MIKKIKTWVFVSLLLFGVVNSLVIAIHPTTVAADSASSGSSISQELQDLLMKHQSLFALAHCYGSDIDGISGSEMDGWAWWYKGHTGGDGIFALATGGASDPDLAKVDCQSDATNDGVQTAFNTLGFSDSVQTFCHMSISYAKNDGEGAAGDYNKCVQDGPDWDANGGVPGYDVLYRLISSQPPTKDEAAAIQAMPDYEAYVLNYLSFVNACSPTFDGAWSQTDKETATTFKLNVVTVTGVGPNRVVKLTPTKVEIPGDKANDTFFIKAGKIVGGDVHNCAYAVQQANQTADAYKQYVVNHTSDSYNTVGSGGIGGTASPTCQVDGFGWLICPIINIVGSVVDFVAGLLQKYLVLSPLSFSTNNNPLYDGWRNILNVANVVLVIAFLAIIFSQATSFGISNYGIKKMLPRIIAAAILMNLSYFICAVLVDLSNIVGVSISDLINTLGSGGASSVTNHGGFVGLTQGIVKYAVGAVVVGAGVILIFFALTPVILAILALYVVIAARDAIITLLIIISPLAFAAWVLPNTEKWFKKWWSLLVEMLMIFPIIMAVFAASSVAASIVLGDTNLDNNDPGPDGLSRLIIALIIQALPLVALPAIIKLAGGALARIEGFAKQQSGKVGTPAGNWIKGERQRRMRDAGARMANNELGQGRTGRTGTALRGVGRAATFTGGFRARRDFRQNTQKAAAERIQQEGVANTVLNDDAFAARAAGVAGQSGVARTRFTAQSTLARAEEESVKMARESMKLEGISSDRTALLKRIHTTQDSAEAGAAAGLLLDTAGTEEFRGLLYDQGIMQRHGQAILSAGKDSYNMVDTKSPDVADFMADEKALSIAQAGGAAAEIDAQRRVTKLPAAKLIKLEPRAMARVFRRAATMTPAQQTELQAQAALAIVDKDFSSAKPATQKALTAMAGGTFTAIPEVIPMIPDPITGLPTTTPVPTNEW